MARLGSANSQMFLLDSVVSRYEQFAMFQPEILSSPQAVRLSVAKATKDSFWVSYEEELTDELIRSLYGPSHSLGDALLIHSLNSQSIAPLAGTFHRFAFSANNGFLPPDELAEALRSDNAKDLFIGGNVDSRIKVLTLWRANLDSLTVPFSAFEQSGDGISPDFTKFAVTDFGQTIQLGGYEAASDAILYEFDSEYRCRINAKRKQEEQSFGASVRRLRKQRGLSREDFEPEITAKTIARIEQGKVEAIHKNTLEVIARRLQVKPEEIETY